jgi:mannobiose 2-epimerase
MNTHLHILEAYAGLVRAWDDPLPRERLRALVEIMLEHILDPVTGHLILFQDVHWQPLSGIVSYGHDIEASWLVCEAAELLDDPALEARAESAALLLAKRVLEGGLDREHGGILNERSADGHIDPNKEWWVEGEAVVGFLNAFQLSSNEEFLDAALDCWKFIDEHVIDHENGDWFNKVARDGTPLIELPKVDRWKCPYHNSRAALEIMARARKLGA